MSREFLTERFISKAVVIALKECARRTENEWDDELVKTVEEVLIEEKDKAA
jgi:hypothetical protein